MSSNDIYIRRCHHCGTSSESENGKVLQCSSCRRSFPPFFFFDERDVPVFCDTETRVHYFGDHPADSKPRLGPRDTKTAPPIWGIAVYWGAE
jgi:hypothetical protein